MNEYSSKFLNNDAMMEALVETSVSAQDARNRANEYAKIFSRNEEMNDLFGGGTNLLEKTFSGRKQKTFSGYAETPLLSTTYFNASVASYVSSFAGYMVVERDFD